MKKRDITQLQEQYQSHAIFGIIIHNQSIQQMKEKTWIKPSFSPMHLFSIRSRALIYSIRSSYIVLKKKQRISGTRQEFLMNFLVPIESLFSTGLEPLETIILFHNYLSKKTFQKNHRVFSYKLCAGRNPNLISQFKTKHIIQNQEVVSLNCQQLSTLLLLFDNKTIRVIFHSRLDPPKLGLEESLLWISL